MNRFIMGALAGALAMWYWGEDIRAYVDSRTRDVRDRAVQKLQIVEERAEDVLDRAKEHVSSTLQAGQDAIRPRMTRG
jgi:macrodomain Ter protein organizer (MatP/YcbG family)